MRSTSRDKSQEAAKAEGLGIALAVVGLTASKEKSGQVFLRDRGDIQYLFRRGKFPFCQGMVEH